MRGRLLEEGHSSGCSNGPVGAVTIPGRRQGSGHVRASYPTYLPEQGRACRPPAGRLARAGGLSGLLLPMAPTGQDSGPSVWVIRQVQEAAR